MSGAAFYASGMNVVISPKRSPGLAVPTPRFMDSHPTANAGQHSREVRREYKRLIFAYEREHRRPSIFICMLETKQLHRF